MQIRFSNIKTIDSGSFGVVKKGYDTKLNRNVAIKTLYREQVQNEIKAHQLLSSLKNPHIVELYDVCYTDQEISLIMELSEEGSIKSSELVPVSVQKMARDVLYALVDIHKSGTLHGDIKPANILRFDHNVFKLCDFGNSQLDFTRSALQQGTPWYLAPEMFYRDYGLSTDMWAFGITLYMLLHNHHPFYKENEYPGKQSYKKLYQYDQIVFNDHVDKKIKKIIMSCLQSEESKRITAVDALELVL